MPAAFQQSGCLYIWRPGELEAWYVRFTRPSADPGSSAWNALRSLAIGSRRQGQLAEPRKPARGAAIGT